MKIALIRAHYDPFGGAERFLNVAADAMIARNHTPTIITRAWPKRTANNAVIAHKIVNPRYVTTAGRDSGFARATTELLKTQDFDLVQSYERFPGCDVFHAVDGVHAEWLEVRRRIQTPWQRLGVKLNPHHHYLLDAERRMYHADKLRAVICISEMVKENVLRHYKIDPEKCHVVYGPIDTVAFNPELKATHREKIRSQYGIAANAPVAIHVGSGFARKGVAALLHAIAQRPGLHAFVIGRDKGLKKYQSLARSLGIAERVFFTGGISDVKPYYAASDVFVMPTIYEPFGLVYGEAMACGLPAVASTTSGAADWITHGINGFVVDALDIRAICESIDAAIAKPDIGLRGRETVLAYGRTDIGEQYNKIYQQLLKA
jgi:UDP-glucose:(heptosyl)LPS alpha-1,3-glucosyltransferase